MTKQTYFKSLTANQRVGFMVMILGGAWAIWYCLDTELWRELVSPTANQPRLAHIIYFSAVNIFICCGAWLVRVTNVKVIAVTGMSVTLLLDMIMRLWPGSRVFYLIYGLLGVTSGLYIAAFFYIFAFSFAPENKIITVALWAPGAYGLPLAAAKVLKLCGPEFSFLFSVILLAAAIIFGCRWQPERLNFPAAGEKQPLPKRLLAAFGLIIAAYYFLRYLTKNIFGTPFFSLGEVDWVACIAGLASFYLLYKLGKKSNLLMMIYQCLICTMLAYVFNILAPHFSLAADLFFGMAEALGVVFVYSMITDIAFKYSRTPHILSIMIAIVAALSIAGYICGLTAAGYFKNHPLSVYGLLLVLNCGMLAVLPVLFRSIGRERIATADARGP